MVPENPFVFDRPLEDGEDLLEREDQLVEIMTAVRARRDVRVEGPHRHGKTSLINVALLALADEDGALGLRVDCSGVLTDGDLARRLEEAYARARAGPAVEDVLGDQLDALSFELSAAADPSKPEARIRALLRLAGRVAEQVGTRAVIAFDDFQDALSLPVAAEAIEAARQGEDPQASYLFAGPDLASHGNVVWSEQAVTVTVGTIEPIVFAGEIIKLFKATGRDAGEAAKVLAIVGAGHPQRTNLLAAELWELTGEGERATVESARVAIDHALVRCTPEFEVRWQALHGNERRVAVAVANQLAPQGTRAQRATGLAGFGAAQRAVQGITSSGVAEVRDDRVTLTDPLFAEWLRSRHPQIPPEPGWQALRRRAELERGIHRGITR